MALIGQSLFGQEVYSHLCKEGHRVVGVFTVPDKDGKADPLGEYLGATGSWTLRLAFSSQVYLYGGYRLKHSPFSCGPQDKDAGPC